MTEETTKREREIVNELIDEVENGEWVVTDYDPSIDPFEPISVEITAEYIGKHPRTDGGE